MKMLTAHLIRVDALASGHPAAAYLLGRGYNPAELGALWEVSYIARSPDGRPALLHRLVLPIHSLRIDATAYGRDRVWFELAGWQVRVIDAELSLVEEKCFSGGLSRTKGKVLYGLPQALATRGPVVVVEDATDVWRLGPNAVATLGTGATRPQQALLCDSFARRPLVVLLGRGASDRAVKRFRSLRSLRPQRAWIGDTAPVVVASLPEGRDDVGECTRAEAWDAVAAALGQPPGSLGMGGAGRSTSDS